MDDTVSVILRFPGERLAQFSVSYYGNPQNSYTVVGTKGALEVNPGFTYGMKLEHLLTEVYGEETRELQEHRSFWRRDEVFLRMYS